MKCPRCQHEVPPPPPLEADYDDRAQYINEQMKWDNARPRQTREWGYCECLRCNTCWDLITLESACHCTPVQRRAGEDDVVPHDPYRNA